jgi:hypothetical protein
LKVCEKRSHPSEHTCDALGASLRAVALALLLAEPPLQENADGDASDAEYAGFPRRPPTPP